MRFIRVNDSVDRTADDWLLESVSLQWYCRRLANGDLIADDTTLDVISQLKLVGDLRRDVLEADRRAGDAFESDAVEGQTRQLADLHLPLDQRVGAWVAVNAQQQEPLALLVVAVVGVEDAADLTHDIVGIHRAGRLHAPCEPQ